MPAVQVVHGSIAQTDLLQGMYGSFQRHGIST